MVADTTDPMYHLYGPSLIYVLCLAGVISSKVLLHSYVVVSYSPRQVRMSWQWPQVKP